MSEREVWWVESVEKKSSSFSTDVGICWLYIWMLVLFLVANAPKTHLFHVALECRMHHQPNSGSPRQAEANAAESAVAHMRGNPMDIANQVQRQTRFSNDIILHYRCQCFIDWTPSGHLFATGSFPAQRGSLDFIRLAFSFLLLARNRSYELQISVGTAGPQPQAWVKCLCRSECQIECLNQCHNRCHKECKNECQIESMNKMSE